MPTIFNIQEVPLGRFLAQTCREKGSGTLELRSANLKKTILIREGIPVHAASNLAEESLGKILIKRGVTDEPTVMKALNQAVQGEARLGETLLAQGAISPHELFEALRHSFGRAILDAFRWTEGQASFEAGEPDLEGQIVLPVDPKQVVLTGVISFSPFELIQSDGAFDPNQPFQLMPVALQELEQLKVNPGVLRIIHAFTNPVSLNGVRDNTDASEDVVHRVAYALKTLDWMGTPEEVAARVANIAAATEAAEAAADASSGEDDGEKAEVTRSALSDEEKAHVDRAYVEAKGRDYFGLLGVTREATLADVRAAFLKKCETLSPAAYAGRELGERRGRLEELFLLLVRAYWTLANLEERNAYLERNRPKRSTPAKPARETQVENPYAINTKLLDYKEHLENGIRDLHGKNPSQALEHLKHAYGLKQEDPSVLAYLGYTLFVVDPVDNREDALKCLTRAIELESDYADGLFMMGRVKESLQEFKEAQQNFARCLRAKPDHAQAKAAVDRVRMKIIGRG